MARITLAWELGGGTGHLQRLRHLALRFVARGHTVSLVARTPAAAWSLFAPLGVHVEPAPLLASQWVPHLATDSFAQVLLYCGYADMGALLAALLSWRGLLQRLQPDILVAEFAPTAMLAARLEGAKYAAVGSGYAVPPSVCPMPFMRPWETTPSTRLARLDADATGAINAAFGLSAGRKASSLTALRDLYPAQQSLLCTFPELDHYPDRVAAEYFGPVFSDRHGAEPRWPAGSGRRVFAYLDGSHVSGAGFIAAAKQMGVPVLVYARGLDETDAEHASSPTVRVIAHAVQLQAALAACDIVVCQGIGTASAALLAAKPLVLLPLHLEQAMIAFRVVSQGLGVAVAESAGADELVQAVRRVLDDTHHHARAAAFAAHYHGFQPSLATEAVADSCEALI